jgi:hypothetical protein
LDKSPPSIDDNFVLVATHIEQSEPA